MNWKKILLLVLIVAAYMIPVSTGIVVARSLWPVFGFIPMFFCFSRGYFLDSSLTDSIVAAILALVFGIFSAVIVVSLASATAVWLTILVYLIFFLTFVAL